MTELEVKLIKLDGGTQARAGTDRETVAEYVEALRESDSTWPFPPVTVYYDGDAYWLADGFHRITAARQFGRFVCEADIRQGTQRDAILHAAGANADHGLRRTAEDKKRAVLRLLEDAEWGRWSDREIARRCKVSHPFVAKIREETGIVTSERVYTDRHGNEAVMDTAGIAKANEDRVFAPVNIGGKPAHPPQTAVTIPKMWEEWGAPVSGEQTATPSPFYVGPMAQGPEVREALDRYLDQWPVNRNFITMRLANVESSGHDKEMQDAVAALGASDSAIYHQAMVLRNNLPGPSWERGKQAVDTAVPTAEQIEGLVTRAANDVIDDGDLGDYAALYRRWLDDGPDDPDWHHLEKRTAGIPHGLVADALRSCYQRVAADTAVSSPEPITQQIIADVEAGYEKEWETAVPAPVYIPARAAHADPRLANLNTALDLVTRLMADTSLTIDVVGPLARALGLMEDAKKALTKRQEYINWLRDYQDDDGRRWTDLSDNQTWHKNSPCHQAFVKAFPKEDFVKSALMDAKTQLEKETAVSQEAAP